MHVASIKDATRYSLTEGDKRFLILISKRVESQMLEVLYTILFNFFILFFFIFIFLLLLFFFLLQLLIYRQNIRVLHLQVFFLYFLTIF